MSRFYLEFFESVPLFLPGITLWLLASVALTPWTARTLRTRRAIALLLLISLGFVLIATLTPTAAALNGEAAMRGACDLSRVGPAGPSELLRIQDPLRNVALFIPLGFALGLLPRIRTTALVIGLAFALPLVIETGQLWLPGFGRGCQSGDVFDNALGLAVGLGGAALLRLGHGRWTRRAALAA